MASDNKLAYVELCPSSVVTHCVSCRLTAAAESCLVIARSTAVEVYTLSVTAVSNAAGGAAGKGRSAPLEGVCGAQLELLTRSELFGVVESLRAVRLPGAAHETLLLAFAEAKLALLEYDPATRALRTRAAHSFDALALSAGCVESATLPPRLTVQPEGSCAALLAHNAMLVMVALTLTLPLTLPLTLTLTLTLTLALTLALTLTRWRCAAPPSGVVRTSPPPQR